MDDQASGGYVLYGRTHSCGKGSARLGDMFDELESVFCWAHSGSASCAFGGWRELSFSQYILPRALGHLPL
jgi:hypothetical protein